MASRFLKKVASLELEEQILNLGAFVGLIGVFLPWLSGEWLGGESVTYSSLGFYTKFLGIAVLLLHLTVLLITFIPLAGGPILIRKRNKEWMRLLLAGEATILVLAILSIMASATLEFARLELRFGVYVTLIGSMVATFYAFLRFQEQRRREVQDLFHHPDDHAKPEQKNERSHEPPPPPIPPAPSEPEEYRLHS